MDSFHGLMRIISDVYCELEKEPAYLQIKLISRIEELLNDWKAKQNKLHDVARQQKNENTVCISTNGFETISGKIPQSRMITRSKGRSSRKSPEMLELGGVTDSQACGLQLSSNLSTVECKIEIENQQEKVSAGCGTNLDHQKQPGIVVGEKVDDDACLTISKSDGIDGSSNLAALKLEPQNLAAVDFDELSVIAIQPNQKSNGQKRRRQLKRSERKSDVHPKQQLTVCEICGARVKIIKVHMMQHGERLHTCPYCSYTSHQRGTVDVHIRRLHTNDRPHLCEICGKGFVKSSLLKEHISVKHDQVKRERTFVCSECSFSTYTRTLLDTHVINRHKPYRRQLYKCEQCDAQLCSAHSLKEHVNLCHTNERPFPCSMCDFAAKSAKRLKNHMIYHSEKAFKCDTCGKMFFTRPQLRRHQLVHTRTTDFSCPYCSYQCSLAENLRKHCQAIHKVTYPAKKRLNYRREFPKPKHSKEIPAQSLPDNISHCVTLSTGLEIINCSA